MNRNSHSEGTCVLLEILPTHKLVQYFQTLHGNDEKFELKGVHITTFEPHLFSSNVEHCSISNVNSYQCSCKLCCPIPVYAMWYSTLFALVSNWNTLYNVMGVKTHLLVNLPQSVSISGAEINYTLGAVTTYVPSCNLDPSMSALKMCIFSNIVMK